MTKVLNLISPEQLLSRTAVRNGETKLGEILQVINSLDELHKSTAPFVLLGIKEDIGIRANLGKGGATECWEYALNALVNVQSNRYFTGENLIISGALEFPGLLTEAEKLNRGSEKDLKQLRQLTSEVDEAVYEILRRIVEQEKIPIIIGGGHNNSYGNIRGVSEAIKAPLSVLNIDPHTDYRMQEGRHSGNGFRYAREQSYLNKYAVYGLHQGYNADNILQEFTADSGLHFETFEAILHYSETENHDRFTHLLNWCGNDALGLELDLDSLTRFPVSALNPSGFSLNEVRRLVRTTASIKQPRYFHICEGSPGRAANELETQLLGKSIAYLIADFINAYQA